MKPIIKKQGLCIDIDNEEICHGNLNSKTKVSPCGKYILF